MRNSNNNTRRFSGNNGVDINELEKAAKSGGVDAVMNKLSPQQGAKLRSILSDEAALQELLSSPKAQALIKELSKNE